MTAVMDNDHKSAQPEDNVWGRFAETTFVDFGEGQLPPDTPGIVALYASPEYYASRDQDPSLQWFDWESLPPSDEAPNAAMQQTGRYPASWLEPDAPWGDVPVNGDVYASPRFHEDKEAGNQKGARAFKDDRHPDGPDSMNEDTRP